MKKVAVVLSGSGVFDGSELHEAVLTLLHLDEQGAQVQCFAPDKEQMHVINHAKGAPAEGQSRNVLEESARISRGEIKALDQLNASEFDALLLPGGFGAAKNLCTFATQGADCTVDEALENVVVAFREAQKPIAPMCIAPAAIAKIFGSRDVQVQLTIGNDPETASAIEAMGAKHVNCLVDDIVVDEANKIVSTPAYMLGPSIAHVNKGVGKLVRKVLELA